MIPDRLQYFLDFFERPTMWPNMDPRTPYLSPKYFKTCKKLWEHPWKIGFISENLKFWKLWKVCVYKFLKFENLKMWNIWAFEILKIWGLKLENLKVWKWTYELENLKFGNFDIWWLGILKLKINILKFENEHLEIWKFEFLRLCHIAT